MRLGNENLDRRQINSIPIVYTHNSFIPRVPRYRNLPRLKKAQIAHWPALEVRWNQGDSIPLMELWKSFESCSKACSKVEPPHERIRNLEISAGESGNKMLAVGRPSLLARQTSPHSKKLPEHAWSRTSGEEGSGPSSNPHCP